MRFESGLAQFRGQPGTKSKCPLFSSDNLGGVGICQITTPAPTDEEVWNWKANVEAGKRFWDAKQANSRAFMTGQMRVAISLCPWIRVGRRAGRSGIGTPRRSAEPTSDRVRPGRLGGSGLCR